MLADTCKGMFCNTVVSQENQKNFEKTNIRNNRFTTLRLYSVCLQSTYTVKILTLAINKDNRCYKHTWQHNHLIVK